jgi:hypothetical protein
VLGGSTRLRQWNPGRRTQEGGDFNLTEDLDALIRELELTADRLRGGEVDVAEAAELVERCAELAARIGGELDQRGRAAEGQERLL